MAIITATIAAISATVAAVGTVGAAAAGAATVGAAVASVAAATVAVANVVGMVGLVLTTVGTITKNKDLMGAGKIMGYVGLGGSIAGFGVGFAAEGFKQFSARIGDIYSNAWDSGVGKMFNGASDAAKGGGAVATKPGGEAVNPNFTQAKGAQPGIGEFPAPGGPNPIMAPKEAATGGGGFLQSSQGAPVTGNAAPSGIDPTMALKGSVATSTGVQTPVAVGTQTPVVAAAGGAATPAAAAPAAASSSNGFLSNPLLPLAAGQMLTGSLGGLFEGGAKEAEVALANRINDQNQAQREYMNRNNSFTGSVV